MLLERHEGMGAPRGSACEGGGRTAFGNPVVPEEKERKPQISWLFFPGGMLNAGTVFIFSPLAISSLIVVKPSTFPSNKNTFFCGIPAFSAARAAISILPGTVNKNLAVAVLSA